MRSVGSPSGTGLARRSSAQVNTSSQIAGLLGPAMVAIGASEAFTYRIWGANIPPLIALNGLLLFVSGWQSSVPTIAGLVAGPYW